MMRPFIMLLQEQLQQSLLAATASGTPLKISISFEILKYCWFNSWKLVIVVVITKVINMLFNS